MVLKGSLAFMQHFKFENWTIGEFDFWCHEQVILTYVIVQCNRGFWNQKLGLYFYWLSLKVTDETVNVCSLNDLWNAHLQEQRFQVVSSKQKLNYRYVPLSRSRLALDQENLPYCTTYISNDSYNKVMYSQKS